MAQQNKVVFFINNLSEHCTVQYSLNLDLNRGTIRLLGPIKINIDQEERNLISIGLNSSLGEFKKPLIFLSDTEINNFLEYINLLILEAVATCLKKEEVKEKPNPKSRPQPNIHPKHYNNTAIKTCSLEKKGGT